MACLPVQQAPPPNLVHNILAIVYTVDDHVRSDTHTDIHSTLGIVATDDPTFQIQSSF